MAKEKLTTAQNLALRGLNLQEKLDILHRWRKNGEISNQQFNFFSNLWIAKETKKVIGKGNPLRRTPETPRVPCRSVIEGEMQKFTDELRSSLNDYLYHRNDTLALLSSETIATFQKYLEKCRCYRGRINQLLVIGLRYPDKRLNRICEAFIKEQRMDPLFPDFHFWTSLWEDGNLVPLDAVRLMLVKTEKGYRINDHLHRNLVEGLIPLITIQRDKEIQRLKWAQQLEGRKREQEIARKTHRLDAFNLLLEVAAEY